MLKATLSFFFIVVLAVGFFWVGITLARSVFDGRGNDYPGIQMHHPPHVYKAMEHRAGD